jgi:hypothetical protein
MDFMEVYIGIANCPPTLQGDEHDEIWNHKRIYRGVGTVFRHMLGADTG